MNAIQQLVVEEESRLQARSRLKRSVVVIMGLQASRAVARTIFGVYSYFMFTCHKDKINCSPTKEISNSNWHEHMNIHPTIIVLATALPASLKRLF